MSPFSREATTTALANFQTFLTTLYLPATHVLTPPPSGWPTLTSQTLAPLRKNPTVVDLLKHMPYILSEGTSSSYPVARDTVLADYRAPHLLEALAKDNGSSSEASRPSEAEKILAVTGPEAFDTVPADVVGLSVGGRYKYPFLLDTTHNVVYWPGSPAPASTHASSASGPGEDDYPASQQGWRSAPAWPPGEFFALLEEMFVSMEFLWLGGGDGVVEARSLEEDGEGELVLRVREVYRGCGWPGEGFAGRREECLARVKAVVEELWG